MCTWQATYVLVMTSQSISSALSPQSSWLSQTQSFEMQTVTHGNSSSAHLSATKNEKKKTTTKQWVCEELVYYYCGHVTAPSPPPLHPHPTNPPWEIDHTTGVYVSYSFRTAMWIHFLPFQFDTKRWRRQGLQLMVKTLTVNPGGVCTQVLPYGRPALSQLS